MDQLPLVQEKNAGPSPSLSSPVSMPLSSRLNPLSSKRNSGVKTTSMLKENAGELMEPQELENLLREPLLHSLWNLLLN